MWLIFLAALDHTVCLLSWDSITIKQQFGKRAKGAKKKCMSAMKIDYSILLKTSCHVLRKKEKKKKNKIMMAQNLICLNTYAIQSSWLFTLKTQVEHQIFPWACMCRYVDTNNISRMLINPMCRQMASIRVLATFYQDISLAMTNLSHFMAGCFFFPSLPSLLFLFTKVSGSCLPGIWILMN